MFNNIDPMYDNKPQTNNGQPAGPTLKQVIQEKHQQNVARNNDAFARARAEQAQWETQKRAVDYDAAFV